MKRRKRQVPKLVAYYRDYLAEESGADFIRAVSSTYQAATLQRLALAGSQIVRRAAVLALGMVGDMRVNHVLGRALRDRDRGVRLLADQWLRDIWLRDGNPAQQKKLIMASRRNQSFQFDEAMELTTALIQEAPAIAEAYHQRAIASACCGQFDDAIADCRAALELNPYHFAAAAAMAQAMLELDDQTGALECFEQALALNPSLDGVRARVRRLQEQLDEM